jgi:hypothetical protein
MFSTLCITAASFFRIIKSLGYLLPFIYSYYLLSQIMAAHLFILVKSLPQPFEVGSGGKYHEYAWWLVAEGGKRFL